MIVTIIYRICLLVLATIAIVALVGRFDITNAAVIWVSLVTTGCLLGAMLLRFSPVGRVGWRNRVAGLLVPWGWRLSGGRLAVGVAASWIVWLALGAAVFILMTGEAIPNWEIVVRFALLLSWLIVGAVLIYCLGTGGGVLRRIVAGLAGLLSGSVLLFALGFPVAALAITGGPVLLIGGGYGVFLATILIFGRHTRWN